MENINNAYFIIDECENLINFRIRGMRVIKTRNMVGGSA